MRRILALLSAALSFSVQGAGGYENAERTSRNTTTQDSSCTDDDVSCKTMAHFFNRRHDFSARLLGSLKRSGIDPASWIQMAGSSEIQRKKFLGDRYVLGILCNPGSCNETLIVVAYNERTSRLFGTSQEVGWFGSPSQLEQYFICVEAGIVRCKKSDSASVSNENANVGGATDHPYKGVWYFANTWQGHCNGTKLDPELLRSWLGSKRLDDIATAIRDPRVFADCSAGIENLEFDSKNGDYFSSETNYFSCVVAINGGGFLERYRLYADKRVCQDAIKRIPPGN